MRSTLALLLLAAPLVAQESAHDRAVAADRALAQAVAADGASALATAFTTQGALVWPGAPALIGAERIGRFLKAQTNTVGARISWQPLHVELSMDSSLALIYGVSTADRPAREGLPAVHRIGRYLAAWTLEHGAWRLEALALTGTFPGPETTWADSLGPALLPMAAATGPVAPFVRADSMFSAQAGRDGAARAFGAWAASDAVTFAPTGELTVGPKAIERGLSGDDATWRWGAVIAGTSKDGSLGWTVGHATITPKGEPEAKGGKSKYLTLWRRQVDGSVRFFSDGGSGRP